MMFHATKFIAFRIYLRHGPGATRSGQKLDFHAFVECLELDLSRLRPQVIRSIFEKLQEREKEPQYLGSEVERCGSHAGCK